MFYLVRNEASYQCFEGILYGVVCFYNKCALIKVALEVNIDGIVFPTNFATLKIRFIPCRVNKTYFSYKSIAIFIAEIAYLFRRFTVQFIPPKIWPHP